jgi:hypothetical protein
MTLPQRNGKKIQPEATKKILGLAAWIAKIWDEFIGCGFDSGWIDQID